MKTWLISAVTLTGMPCLAQYAYPPIVVDEAQTTLKIEYLSKLKPVSYEFTNVILILADDLSRQDITLYDPEGVPTPHLDALAQQGVCFTEATSTCPVCSPSRVSMLTGRYQQRFGYERQPMQQYARNGFENWFFKSLINTKPMFIRDPWYSPPDSEIKKQGLPVSEVSLFEIFKAAGYKTACIGKWHLGYNEPFLPHNKSVDEFYGFYEAFSLYAPLNQKDIVNSRQNTFHNKHIWHQKRKGPSAIIENGRVIDESEYLTFRIAQKARDFIDRHQDEPFFLYVPFSAPHTPFQAPEEYVRRFDFLNDLNKQVYWAMITILDEAVGQIIAKIGERHLDDNTLIIFTSDNGGATYTGATDNGILNGGKFTQLEGGVKVPFILRWKGHLPEARMYSHPVSLMDVFSTAIAAAGIPEPGYLQIDGVDLVPCIRMGKDQEAHEYLFWRTDFNKAVRKGKWKLIINTRDDEQWLFNLETDQGEEHNLSSQYPELTRELIEAFSNWEKELLPAAWPGIMEIEFEINGKKTRWAI